MTQAPSAQPASNPEKKNNNKNRLIPGEYQTKSYKYIEYCQGARRRGIQD